MNDTSTTPSSTLTPNTAMYPTAAEMLKFVPQRYSAKVPPMIANGRLSIINSASPTDWKALNKSTKMIKRTIGTMMYKRVSARCWSSKRPLQTLR